jgi:hypothetical protein
VGGGDRVNLDLQILRSGAGYRASVVASPGGEGDAEIALPERRVDLERLLAGTPAAALPGMLDVIPGRAGRLRPTAMAEFGRRLFAAVFVGTVGLAYRRSVAIAEAQGVGLRIRIRLASVPELLDLPWELLYDDTRGGFVASSSETPLVRYLDLPQPVEPLEVDPPIRMLVVVSSPSDREPVDVAEEWRRLTTALERLIADGRFAVERLEVATPEHLRATIESGNHHVLHYIGHGGFDESTQQGVLLLEADDGTSSPVRAEDLVETLTVSDALRLVVLNTCDGARGSVVDPFAGTAQSLVGRGTPAVVAMQFEVTDEAAVGFAEGFYTAVANGSAVDDALTEGRLSMMTRGDGSEWATPVLYSHVTNLRIFAVAPLLPPPPPFGALPEARRLVAGDLEVHADPDHGVRLDRSAAEIVPRSRALPVAVLPPPFPLLLGREAEMVAASEVAPGESIVFAAGSGWGKTALLRAVANRVVGAAPGGLLFLRVLSRPVVDVLQFVFEGLFETDVPFKPTNDQLATWLGAMEVAMVLDDVEFGADEVATLSAILPRGRLVIAAREAPPGEGRRVVALAGLPTESGVRLIELELGRSLLDAERPIAERLCTALQGNPARILEEAGRAWEGEQALEVVLDDLLRSGAPGAAGETPALTGGAPQPTRFVKLPPAELRALGVLAAASPAPVHVSHLVAVADLADPVPVLESLERHGLIRAQSPLYNVAFPVTGTIASVLQAPRWAASMLDHLSGWAERANPDEVVRDADLLLTSMRLGREEGRNDEVGRLGRMVEGPLIVGRRWGQWGLVASMELAAAVATGSLAQQAWASHQLGSRALGLGDLPTAREDLGRALKIRESIGDSDGAEVTRHNLGLSGGGAPPPSRRPRRGEGGKGHGMALGVVLGVALAVGAIGFLLWLFVLRGSGDAPIRSVEPRQLPFGEVTRGASSTLALAVTNTGDGALTVTGIFLDPVDPAFAFQSDCGDPLEAGDACHVEVTFTPDRQQRIASDLVIEDDSGGGPERVRLVGTGVGERVPGIRFNPAALDFESQAIGNTTSKQVTVISSGETLLHIGDVVVQDGPAFTIDTEDCSQREFAPEDRCRVLVSFTPTGLGPASGQLVVVDDAGEGTQIVELTGTGVTDLPNLIVVDFLQIGDPVQGDGIIDVPVQLVVANDGDAIAGSFKVSSEYTGGITSPTGAPPAVVEFRADPSDDVAAEGFYPFTSHDLEPGAEVTFTGVLRFSDKEEGSTVTVTAIVDSCSGDEFSSPGCRVAESLEDDNGSDPLPITLPSFSEPVE